MTLRLALFYISVLLFLCVIYMVGGIWFRGKRGPYLRSFLMLGLVDSFWTLFNGTNVLLSEDMYIAVYPHVMVLACALPPILLRYILFFTNSRLAEKRWVTGTLTAVASVNIAMLVTNPLHHEFISGYDGLHPVGGKLFPVYALLAYMPVLIAVVLTVRYIVKNIRKTPALGYVGVGMLLPVILNVLYTFNIVNIGYDITPWSFVIMYGCFAMYSIQLRLFDVSKIALTSLFNSLSDMFLTVDSAGIVTDANAKFRNTFPDMELMADKTNAKEILCYLSSVSGEGEGTFSALKQNGPGNIHNSEVTLTVDGRHRHYLLSKDIITERGQYAGYNITISDISDYRRFIDEINEKNAKLTQVTELKNLAESVSKAKSDFLSHMSHEMRTPMNAIIGMTAIGKKAKDMEHKNHALNKIGDASSHLLGIINDVLDMAKIEANKLELAPVEFHFERMLQNILTVVDFRIEEKRQKLTVNVDNSIPHFLTGDDQRLTQVITNLLSNAVKFTPEGGDIRLDAFLNGETDRICELRVEVTDSGIGISPEQQEKLFGAFEQAESGISREYGGTGLGLVISKRIIELMGGKIWIESELGKGAKFIFTVKAARSERSPDATPAPGDGDCSAVIPGEFEGKKLLIAEDIEINREILIALLEESGIEIDCAENGIEALEMIKAAPEAYDIVFMDLQMPKMDGLEATRRIRAQPERQRGRLPVIAMTANVFKSDIDACIAAGMDSHLGKPLDIEKVLEKLRKYLNRN